MTPAEMYKQRFRIIDATTGEVIGLTSAATMGFDLWFMFGTKSDDIRDIEKSYNINIVKEG